MYDRFLELQEEAHFKNQKKIRVGLKINIFLPLIFLVISFLSNRSKLVFLVLWIVSLFGIAFYLLYVEYMDFKMQDELHQVGISDKEPENLIGDEVIQGMRDMNDMRKAVKEEIKDKRAEIKDKKEEIKSDIRQLGDKLKK